MRDPSPGPSLKTTGVEPERPYFQGANGNHFPSPPSGPRSMMHQPSFPTSRLLNTWPCPRLPPAGTFSNRSISAACRPVVGSSGCRGSYRWSARGRFTRLPPTGWRAIPGDRPGPHREGTELRWIRGMCLKNSTACPRSYPAHRQCSCHVADLRALVVAPALQTSQGT